MRISDWSSDVCSSDLTDRADHLAWCAEHRGDADLRRPDRRNLACRRVVRSQQGGVSSTPRSSGKLFVLQYSAQQIALGSRPRAGTRPHAVIYFKKARQDAEKSIN